MRGCACFLYLYKSSPYQQTVLVYDEGLTGRDAPYGLAEAQGDARVVYGVAGEVYLRRDGGGLVADTRLYIRGLRQPLRVAETGTDGMHLGGVEVIMGAECYFVAVGIDAGDEAGCAECDAEPFALSDGVVAETGVGAEDIAVGIDIVARGDADTLFGQEAAVVVAGDKAYFLALGLLAQFLKAFLQSDSAHFGLGESAKREDGAPEVVFGEHPEEIGLVLAGVHGIAEVEMSVVLRNACIVPGGDAVATVLVGGFEQLAPLDVRIAEDTWIGRASAGVLGDKIGDDMPTERVAEINDMMLETKRLRQVLRLHDALNGAAPFLAGEAGLFDTVEGAERDADEFVPLLQKEHGRYRGVDTARHCHEDTHRALIFNV